MRQTEEYRKRVLENSDIGPLEDGFQYYFLAGLHGALSANDLRIIADELDRRNATWQKQIEQDLSELR